MVIVLNKSRGRLRRTGIWNSKRKGYRVKAIVEYVYSCEVAHVSLILSRLPALQRSNKSEHLWDVLERRVRARSPHPKNRNELAVALTEEWLNIDQTSY